MRNFVPSRCLCAIAITQCFTKNHKNQREDYLNNMISNLAGIEHLAEIFIQQGIKDIVISPGSRNAPMILTFPEYEEFTCYSIIDERSAGFFALGLAQKTCRPVVLNCTSGTALLNYAPALAEAYYQNIPLIVLSADRPGKLIDHGDGQAIRQFDVYRNFIRKSVQLPENPQSEKDLVLFQIQVIEAIAACQFPVSGPVHLNFPLDEPIYGTKEKQKPEMLSYDLPKRNFQISEEKKQQLSQEWKQAKKKLIIVGQQNSDSELHKILLELAKQPDCVVMTETTSNQNAELFVNHIDRVLSQINENNEADFFPDLLISLGGQMVSKKIKAWLRKDVIYQHWEINLDEKAMDTFFHLSEHLRISSTPFLQFLSSQKPSASQYRENWQKINKHAQVLHHQYVKSIPYSDMMVFDVIRQKLPKTMSNIHFANSTPIRYSQLFTWEDTYEIDCNRGVSGIDGSISTALGASLVNSGITCMITGDLSFFYDNNALWNRYLHPNFRVMVINNAGGGIFRFIDGPLQSGKLDFFEATHQRKAKSLTIEAGMEYSECHGANELSASLENFFQDSNQAKLLEIFTPRELNDQVLKEYFSFLRKGTLYGN